MPLIFFHYPEGTFTQDAIDSIAEKVSKDAGDAERLADNKFVRSTTWLYFNEYPGARVYHGGKSGGTNVISIELNAIFGGFDAEVKASLTKKITDAVAEHATGVGESGLAPIYLLFRDVPEINWGFNGAKLNLDFLKNPPGDQQPL